MTTEGAQFAVPVRPPQTHVTTVERPSTLRDGVARLEALGERGAIVAGGTWIMRDLFRGERQHTTYLSLKGIPGLDLVDESDDRTRVGALATHEQLARLSHPALRCLSQAARASAFPAVRATATIGGNLCAHPFPEADLVPALLASDASIEFEGPTGSSTQRVATFLEAGGVPSPAHIITGVTVPAPPGRCSAFRRLTVRGGAEYAIASIAASVVLGSDCKVSDATVVVGGVEPVAKPCPRAAMSLIGKTLTTTNGYQAGEVAAGECVSRDGLDAPAWYRTAVLPALLRDLTADLIEVHP